MKRIYILTFIIALLTTSCVTKQKYTELDNNYKATIKNLDAVSAAKINLENTQTELNHQIEQLKTTVEQLKQDTFDLSKKLAQSERDYTKSKQNYDDLLLDLEKQTLGKNTEINGLLLELEKIKAELKTKEMELNAKAKELAELDTDLKAKETKLKELQNILNQKDQDVKNLKNKLLKALKGFEGSGLQVYEKNGKVYVSMDNKLLFASGSWAVSEDGQNALKELAKILETEKDISVMIEGHTDDVPYLGNSNIKDNWDLSVIRATAIVKIILKNGKINPQRLTASGRGEFCPIENGKTPEVRAKNRRTEIILTPKLDELFKVLESN